MFAVPDHLYAFATITVSIVAETSGTIRVQIPVLNSDKYHTVTKGWTEISIPYTATQFSNNTVEKKGIYLVSDTDISVNVLIVLAHSSEGFLALPVTSLSNEYIIVSLSPSPVVYPSEFLVVSTQDRTNISIRFPKRFNGHFLADNETHISLNKYETYQFKLNQDLSGTIIRSTAPVAVMSGMKYIMTHPGTAGSFLAEQLPPSNSLGTSFIIPPLHGRSGFMVKIIPRDDTTTVNIMNKTTTLNLIVNKSLPVDLYFGNDPVFIHANKPILVTQFSLTYHSDHKGSEFMSIVPSITQYMEKYKFVVSKQAGVFHNYICLITPTGRTSDIRLDNMPVEHIADNTYISTNDGNFTIWTISVSVGNHTVDTTRGNVLFAALLYGFVGMYSYGFPLGIKLRPKRKLYYICDSISLRLN